MGIEDERPGKPSKGYVGVDAVNGMVVLEFPGVTHGAVGLTPSQAIMMAIKLLQAIESIAAVRAAEKAEKAMS